VRLEHRVQVLDAAELIRELRFADLADERRRLGRLITPHLKLGGARRRLEYPRILGGACALCHGPSCRSMPVVRRKLEPAAVVRVTS